MLKRKKVTRRQNHPKGLLKIISTESEVRKVNTLFREVVLPQENTQKKKKSDETKLQKVNRVFQEVEPPQENTPKKKQKC